MNRVIIVGSPRSNGRSAHLAEMLFEANIDECPEDEIYLVPVSELEISPCIACGACRREVEVVYEGEGGEEIVELEHRCVIDDEMQEVYPLLDTADELTIVAPVFFSGASASLKALLDRLQPHFWADTRKNPKRPATLHVIGEGGDPHGYAPLVSEVRSALAVAGFKLERVLDWVGKIDESGEITAEAEVVEDGGLVALVAEGAAGKGDSTPLGDNNAVDSAPLENGSRRSEGKPRPKLDLSGGGHGGRQAGAQGDRKAGGYGGRQASAQGARKAGGPTNRQDARHNAATAKRQGAQNGKSGSGEPGRGKTGQGKPSTGKAAQSGSRQGQGRSQKSGQPKVRNDKQGKGRRRG